MSSGDQNHPCLRMTKPQLCQDIIVHFLASFLSIKRENWGCIACWRCQAYTHKSIELAVKHFSEETNNLIQLQIKKGSFMRSFIRQMMSGILKQAQPSQSRLNTLVMLRHTMAGVSWRANYGDKPCKDPPTTYSLREECRAHILAKIYCVCSCARHASSFISFNFLNLSNKFREAGEFAPRKRQWEVKRACEHSILSPEPRLSIRLCSPNAD